ncbi:MAG TPA: SAM-dependent methyltransferase, partial [Bacillota bacterium]|nr:SAM-dependent methyltransferase [Bacillota bacterium]
RLPTFFCEKKLGEIVGAFDLFSLIFGRQRPAKCHKHRGLRRLMFNGAFFFRQDIACKADDIAERVDDFSEARIQSRLDWRVRMGAAIDQPSQTAMLVAFCRALAAKDEREEIKGPDDLAELFLTEEGRQPLINKSSRTWAIQNLVTAPLYGYFMARTAYLDQVFKESLAAEIPQIVLLGAGYDTRAYRYRDLIRRTRIFELDIAPTQKQKQETLKKADIEIPAAVVFVSVNFKQDQLTEVLRKNGFDPTAKTLFIWEGVSYYLTKDAVVKTLLFIKENSPSGSILCFDYLNKELESVSAAEPFQFWLDPGRLESFMETHGFKVLEHLDAPVLERRYLTLADGTLAEKTLTQFSLVQAVV